jgi:hypothetical protein
MSWSEDLIELFNDPILSDVRPFAQRITSDDRLVESFLEIRDWVLANGCEPKEEGADFSERKLYRRLLSIRSDEERSAFLKDFDNLNLLDIQ